MNRSFYPYIAAQIFSLILCLTTSDYDIFLNSAKPIPGFPIELPLFVLLLVYPIAVLALFEIFLFGIGQQTGSKKKREPKEPIFWYSLWQTHRVRNSNHVLRVLSDVLTWWLLPSVLLLLAVRAIAFHSWLLSYTLLAITALGTIHIYLRQLKWSILTQRRTRWVLMKLMCGLILILDLALASFVVPRSQLGWPREENLIGLPEYHAARLPFLLERARAVFLLDIAGLDLSTGRIANSGNQTRNLEGRNFSGAVITDCNLSHTIFSNTNLLGAAFHSCDMSYSSFNLALLHHAKFEDIDLRHCSLYRASLLLSRFERVVMDTIWAPLLQAEFASFNSVYMRGAEFQGSYFHGVSLNNVIGESINFGPFIETRYRPYKMVEYETRLIGVDISSSEFRNTSFRFADIANCDVRDSDLSNSTFLEAIIQNPFLVNCKMTSCEVGPWQLATAQSLYKSTLDSFPMIQLQNQRPDLFQPFEYPHKHIEYSNDSKFCISWETTFVESMGRTITLCGFSGRRL